MKPTTYGEGLPERYIEQGLKPGGNFFAALWRKLRPRAPVPVADPEEANLSKALSEPSLQPDELRT